MCLYRLAGYLLMLISILVAPLTWHVQGGWFFVLVPDVVGYGLVAWGRNQGHCFVCSNLFS